MQSDLSVHNVMRRRLRYRRGGLRVRQTRAPTRAAQPQAPQTLTEAIKHFFHKEPEAWDGTINLLLSGKTGELLYLSGLIPGIKSIAPRCKVTVHIASHYGPIVAGLKYKFDDFATETNHRRQPSLAHGVVDILLRYKNDFHISGHNALSVCAYRRHGHSAAPFYKLFASSVGVSFTKPDWIPTQQDTEDLRRFVGADDRLALVFASANHHSGSIRSMDLGAAKWSHLAKQCREQGLRPVATGHKDDPKPSMPGWDWIDFPNPKLVLAATKRADRVVGFNSGIVFAAILLSQGRTTMFNAAARNSLYDFSGMPDVIDPGRHFQYHCTSVTQISELIERALK